MGIIFIFFLLFIMFKPLIFTGNSLKEEDKDKVTCNSPYIKVGTSCCLDQNSNKICDSDETLTQSSEYCGDGICQ